MREEDLVKKLEHVDLPKADLKEHQRQLRAALLATGSRRQRSRQGIAGSFIGMIRAWPKMVSARWESPQRTRRLAAVCTLAIMIIVIALAVAPFLEGRSRNAEAAEIARSSPEVREALGGQDGRVIRVIEEGDTSVVFLRCADDSTGSGDVVVASVDMANKTVTSATLVSSSKTLSARTDWYALVGELACDGSDVVFLSTPLELRAISNGMLLWSVMTSARPEAVIDDVTGDGTMEVVVSSGTSIECRDGFTGERVWRFECGERRVFLDGVGWGGESPYIWGVEILDRGGAQSICVHTDWQVYCLDPWDGTELWQTLSSEMITATAAVPDRDGDGADELLIGTCEGDLRLVGGSEGEVRWRKDIGSEWMENGEPQYGGAVTIEVTDGLPNTAVLGVGDGRVCLIDLERGDLKWENQITYRELANGVETRWVPDVTGDEVPDILVNKGYLREAVGTSASKDGGGSVSVSLRAITLLSGLDGNEVWASEMHTADSPISIINSQPAVLDLNPQLGVRVVGLKDGQTETYVATLPLQGTAAKLALMSDGGYLLLSEDGSMTAVSPDGAVRWGYSRLSSAAVETGKFNSDATPDFLVLGAIAGEDRVKQISVLDGATRDEIWRRNVTGMHPAVAGGLYGVQAIDDLTGDGIEDIVGWAGETVFRLSGADGSLDCFEIGGAILSVQPIEVHSGVTGIMASSAEGLVVVAGDGSRLWGSSFTDWRESAPGAVLVINDLNQDGVSDLVLSFADSILVATSRGVSPLSFAISRSFPADDNQSIELRELTNDIDGDGSQEIACLQYDRGVSGAGGVLLVFSPTTGRIWHRWDMPVTVDLACADFNGDGFLDTLLHRQGELWEAQSSNYYGQVYQQTSLEVRSGKDDSVLWVHRFDEDRWHAGSEKMPAAPAGDLSGDGIEDLAVSSIVVLSGGVGMATDADGTTETRFLHETHVSVYQIPDNALLKEIVVPQAQRNSWVASEESRSGRFEPVSGPGDAMRLASDLNGDGQQEMAVLASYLPTGGHCLALVDMRNEALLGYSAALNTLDFFETNLSCTLGFASEGSVCLVRLHNGLKVTCPGEGDTVGSRVRIAWEGAADSSFTSVFVDGYENAQTSGNDVILPLAPGQHEVVVRSIDQYGTVTYAAVHFRAEGAPWALILACLSVIGLFVVYLAARWARVMRNRAARRASS